MASYDRPLTEIANGVVDSRGRFYNFTSVSVSATGNILTGKPYVRYYIKDVVLTGENEGVKVTGSISVATTIENVAVTLAYIQVPVTIAAVNGVAISQEFKPHVLSDEGANVAATIAATISAPSVTIVYAVIDEPQDVKLT